MVIFLAEIMVCFCLEVLNRNALANPGDSYFLGHIYSNFQEFLKQLTYAPPGKLEAVSEHHSKYY